MTSSPTSLSTTRRICATESNTKGRQKGSVIGSIELSGAKFTRLKSIPPKLVISSVSVSLPSWPPANILMPSRPPVFSSR